MGAAAKAWNETIDRSSVPVLLVKRDQTVSYANRAAHELLDYPHHALGGLSLKWLSPPSCHAELAGIEAIFAGEDVRRVHTAALRSDGTRVEVAMVLEPCLDERGQVAAVSVRIEALPTQSAVGLAPVRSSSAPARLSRPTPAILPPAEHLQPANDQQRESANERLDSALQLLRWLAERLTSPSVEHEDPRERARMLLVLRDASELVSECRRELSSMTASVEIPLAPRLPRFGK
jgi:PAS domain S-box-containing protein